jgi:hypothetical protein
MTLFVPAFELLGAGALSIGCEPPPCTTESALIAPSLPSRARHFVLRNRTTSSSRFCLRLDFYPHRHAGARLRRLSSQLVCGWSDLVWREGATWGTAAARKNVEGVGLVGVGESVWHVVGSRREESLIGSPFASSSRRFTLWQP